MNNIVDDKNADLDKNSPHYVHNLFMRNARVWNDDMEAWTMDEKTFTELVAQFQSSQKQSEAGAWDDVKEQASEMCRHPGYDYNVPDWAVMDFIDNLSKKYSIQLK